MTDLQPTSPAAWKAKSSAPVVLPSGNVMRIRRIGMQTLIATGKVPNALMGIMKSAVDKGTGMQGVEGELKDLMGDEKALRDLTQFTDDLLVMTSIEPKVYPAPKTEADREDDKLYVDEVEEEDKAFLFQLLQGGTADVEQFRRESRSGVAAVFGRENLDVPSEQPA